MNLQTSPPPTSRLRGLENMFMHHRPMVSGGQQADALSSSNNDDRQRVFHRRFAKLRQLLIHQRQQHAKEMQNLREEMKLPAAELMENSSEFMLTVDLPGVLSSDLKVSVDDGVLSIEGTRKHMSMDGTSCVKTQTVQRRYAINADVVDTEKLEANLVHGVLTVRAPKRLSVQRQGPVHVSAEDECEETIATSKVITMDDDNTTEEMDAKVNEL